MRFACFILGLLLAFPAVLPASADELTPSSYDWRWSDDQAQPDFLAAHAPEPYQVVLSAHGSTTTMTVRNGSRSEFVSGELLAFVFLIADDHLYLAEFKAEKTGGAITAVDLKSSRELWHSRLVALGYGGNYKDYKNRINLRIDGERLIIYGNETSGHYIEVKDTRSGTTLLDTQLYIPGPNTPIPKASPVREWEWVNNPSWTTDDGRMRYTIEKGGPGAIYVLGTDIEHNRQMWQVPFIGMGDMLQIPPDPARRLRLEYRRGMLIIYGEDSRGRSIDVREPGGGAALANIQMWRVPPSTQPWMLLSK